MSEARRPCWQPEEECMERDDLEQLQLERLEATLSRVYRNVPFYRKRFDEIGFAFTLLFLFGALITALLSTGLKEALN